jgi:anti-sigma28 factor (negative regulator of flagellin synthesis)
MKTLTVQINERSKIGKAILDLLISTSKETKAINVVEEESIYNPKFVEKIKKSQQEIKDGKYKVIDTNNLWESIGL